MVAGLTSCRRIQYFISAKFDWLRRNRLFEIPRNLGANPFSHWNRNAIPDHSISVVVTPLESETVRHALQPRILPNRVRPHAIRKPPIFNQSRAHVFGIVRNAGGCDIAAFRVADNRPVTILASQAPTYVVRNVWCRIRFKYLCQRDSPFPLRLAPREICRLPQ